VCVRACADFNSTEVISLGGLSQEQIDGALQQAVLAGASKPRSGESDAATLPPIVE
jgi:hypothetical protein